MHSCFVVCLLFNSCENIFFFPEVPRGEDGIFCCTACVPEFKRYVQRAGTIGVGWKRLTKGDYRQRSESSWYMSRSRTVSLYEWIQQNPLPRTKRAPRKKENKSSRRKRKRVLKEVVAKLNELTELVESLVDSE